MVFNPWEGTVVYLITTVPGKPCINHTDKTLDQYIEWLAAIHNWGEQYPHENLGSLATWNAKWEERHVLLKTLEPFSFLDQALITRAIQELEARGPQEFTQVIVHGDARLCHALYEGEKFSGFIDFDQSTQGERWMDLCYGLISGPEPHSGSQLTLKQVQYALRHYHEWLKIPPDERAALKACFAYAGLETLSELALFHQRGVLPLEELRRTEGLLMGIMNTKELL
jgi:Ser/Thr protein kinase RdoA (MazF antagonist)